MLAFEDGEASEPRAAIDNGKAQRELGLQITPVRSTLVDMAVTMMQLGLVDPQRA